MSSTIAIIGAGRVGGTLAYSLLTQRICRDVLLYDKNTAKAESQAADIKDGLLCAGNHAIIKVGSYSDIARADIVINCAGNSSMLVSEDRMIELCNSESIADEIAEKLNYYNFGGIFINVSNPCDIITARLAEKLRCKCVFGTGTALDTERFRYTLMRSLGIGYTRNALVLGEHGEEQVFTWSLMSERFDEGDMMFCEKLAKNRAWDIIGGKQCTEYGIASVVVEIIKSIHYDEKEKFVVSCKLNGEYGCSDVVAGVPVVIGKDGIERIVELNISDDELNKFRECCEIMKQKQRR